MTVNIDESDIVECVSEYYENDIDFLFKMCDTSIVDLDLYRDLIINLSKELKLYSENSYNELCELIKNVD